MVTTCKDRYSLRTHPATSVPIFILILGGCRNKARVTLPAQTMSSRSSTRSKKRRKRSTSMRRRRRRRSSSSSSAF